MPRRPEAEKLVAQNRALRAENRELKREATRLRKRLLDLAGRVDRLRLSQAALTASSARTDDLLRWLRARMEILERELKQGD